ncbi:MAG: 3-methyl-2-oxobutanoate hydroxymethyltransferase [Deltaproteobacteria bacterium]|nr:3-methyl-2-oxobutanoate hydroxymethyltransferase [Deltaproteobacteria bacterium]PXF55285.1 MAG: 3-methyl-2-oxobutanoate hydroxymethyltransferase [Deltaproteobacteria bacterium]
MKEKKVSKKAVSLADLQNKKASGDKITMLTAYDYSMARVIDEAGLDIVLVGDSLGMVALGYGSTVPVTMEEMIHHCRAVRRGVNRALLIGDMPYLSYQVSKKEAVRNAGLFLKKAGCHGVKLEGGSVMAPTIEKIVKAGISVMGHIGLTPQTATALGGYRVQGRDLESARKLLEDARAVVDAGAFSLVLECIPSALAKIITGMVPIPTIGIGAGPHCDGQVLVTNDLLGLFEKFTPSFVKRYANLAPQIKEALDDFIDEVKRGVFPGPEHSFGGGEELLEELEAENK